MSVRTSLSHPLEIASVRPSASSGRIGITFCPGKQQSSAMTGAWARDLGIDLDVIEAWGAVAVVTLIEDHEIVSLNVAHLGEEVRLRHMHWLHLPIADFSVPGAAFEAAWIEAGEGIRARLRDGFDIVVHCKGGLGRAGLVAARLMVELGDTAEGAITAVRAARPGAIETSAQADYVRQQSVASRTVATSRADIVDRGLGALLGLAVGDAIGTTLEFAARDSYQPVTDMTGGGPFHLKPGEWTDDTAMALALADSLIANPRLDEADLMRRFVEWSEQGTYSCTGFCFDVGITTKDALARWKRNGDPIAGSTASESAGNGSLMRLAPVALQHRQDRKLLAEIAARQSRTTHAAPEAVDACIVYADILADAIVGRPRAGVLSPRQTSAAGKIAGVVGGSWRGKARREIRSSGYVADSLEAALWCVGRSSDFADTVLMAANLGRDADTTAAIAGQLAGALYGMRGIPPKWLDMLAWRERIEAAGRALIG
jgi:ADP-ribosyl-[dinitrogen reductase] hydrolase